MSQVSLSSETEIVNEEVKVKIQRKPACRVLMDVEVSRPLIQDAQKKAVKAVGKEVTLPGFRKGRAPEVMIAQKFPKEVEKQLHKETADLAFVAAQKLAKIPVLNQNSSISFHVKKFEPQQAELSFSFETEPQIPSVDPSLFVPKPIEKAEVTTVQIEEAIHQMRFFYAEWKQIEDRPIQEGDFILIDLDTIDDGKEQRVFHHVRFEVSKNRMALWMQKLVQGAKAGDVLEGISEADEGASEAEKKEFQPKKVKLSILKVEEAHLPPLDDDFAKKVGAANMEQVGISVEKILREQLEEKAETERREQVNQFLIEHYPFELPYSLLDTEKNHRLNQMLQDPNAKERWARMSQEERKEIETKLMGESEQAVRLFYLSRKIVQDAQIPISHQEVQNAAVSIYRTHADPSSGKEVPKEVFALALSKIILLKAQEHLMKKA